MTFTAVVLVCTMMADKPLTEQSCIQLTDSKGPHQTMQACTRRVAEIAMTREVIGAASYMLATTLKYGGPVNVRGGCAPSKGRSA